MHTDIILHGNMFNDVRSLLIAIREISPSRTLGNWVYSVKKAKVYKQRHIYRLYPTSDIKPQGQIVMHRSVPRSHYLNIINALDFDYLYVQ